MEQGSNTHEGKGRNASEIKENQSDKILDYYVKVVGMWTSLFHLDLGFW
jgi:hypothetical protein